MGGQNSYDVIDEVDSYIVGEEIHHQNAEVSKANVAFSPRSLRLIMGFFFPTSR